jgi:hypothetical protein
LLQLCVFLTKLIKKNNLNKSKNNKLTFGLPCCLLGLGPTLYLRPLLPPVACACISLCLWTLKAHGVKSKACFLGLWPTCDLRLLIMRFAFAKWKANVWIKLRTKGEVRAKGNRQILLVLRVSIQPLLVNIATHRQK